MAEFVGRDRRTAERMRDVVDDVFGPLDHIDDGRKRRFRLAARGLDRFVTTPTIDELTELENAARALETAQAPDRAAHLRSLRDKIGASLRTDERRVLSLNVEEQIRVEAFACQVGPHPMSDPSVLSALREALLAGRVIRFNYGGDDGEPPRWRKVVPYGLLFGPRYYLVASVKSLPGPVLFRLDRIHGVKVTDETGRPPDDFNLKAYAEHSFGVFQEDPEDVELRFAPSAARDARTYLFHPTQTFADEADGSLTVRFHAGGVKQIAYHLMTWGPAVTIVAPPTLQDEMCEQVEALHAHYVASQPSAGSKRRPSTRNSSKSSSRKVPITSVKGS
jgi:predicted DNA-binding transcriptional regulator YafY